MSYALHILSTYILKGIKNIRVSKKMGWGNWHAKAARDMRQQLWWQRWGEKKRGNSSRETSFQHRPNGSEYILTVCYLNYLRANKLLALFFTLLLDSSRSISSSFSSRSARYLEGVCSCNRTKHEDPAQGGSCFTRNLQGNHQNCLTPIRMKPSHELDLHPSTSVSHYYSLGQFSCNIQD